MTYQEFVRKYNVKFKCEWWHENPSMEDSNNMDHWKCKIAYNTRSMTLYYSMGFGHNGKVPTVQDVLECLAMDCSMMDQPFEDWASDLGYDTDFRKAEKIYKVCIKQEKSLKRVFGYEYQTLLDCEEE